MPLPPPGSGTYWKNYEIDTPTFQLTPIEKPDMSPFLVHMTGKNQIIGILKGENTPKDFKEIGEKQGFLRAGIPEGGRNIYNAKVVCFTETPTFALDFFRYRSFHRWSTDQRFGIGFDKASLVNQGIRPAVYLENDLIKHITYLYRRINDRADGLNRLNENDDINNRLIEIINETYPLIFPLLQNETQQGFMWEREWRFTNVNGLVFNHRDVRIICCPQNEENEIRDILGASALRVQFIRAWREYDDVTEYLRRQQKVWQQQDQSVQQAKEDDQKITQIRELIQQYQIAKHSLDAYQEFTLRLEAEKLTIQQQSKSINEKIIELQNQVSELEKQEDAKKKMLREPGPKK
ncbi:MAG TPA: hypothetical protein VGB07_36285 [Blastocatellia bacterium]